MKKSKKMNKKQIISSVGIYVICFIGGFGYYFIRDIIDSTDKFDIVPMPIGWIMLIGTFFLSVAVHELGHAISFLNSGMGFRALLITIFGFIKEDGIIRFKFISMKNLGGLFVPSLNLIKNNEEYLFTKNAFSKALIMGPISSIFLSIVSTIIGTIILISSRNQVLNGYILSFLTSLNLINIIIVLSSFYKNDLAVGDFPAYKLSKFDDFFTSVQIYSYAYLSDNPEQARDKSRYIRNYILDGLEEKFREKAMDSYTLNAVDTIFTEYLSGYSKDMPKVIEDYINYIVDNRYERNKLKKSLILEGFYFRIVIWLYRYENRKEKALELYEDLKDSIKEDAPSRKYFFKQVEQALNINDNRDFLLNNDNIVNSHMHEVYKLFKGAFMDEIDINKKLCKEDSLDA